MKRFIAIAIVLLFATAIYAHNNMTLDLGLSMKQTRGVEVGAGDALATVGGDTLGNYDETDILVTITP